MKGLSKETLRYMTIPELVIMQHELRTFPEDKECLESVMKEIKFRDTGKEWEETE